MKSGRWLDWPGSLTAKQLDWRLSRREIIAGSDQSTHRRGNYRLGACSDRRAPLTVHLVGGFLFGPAATGRSSVGSACLAGRSLY